MEDGNRPPHFETIAAQTGLRVRVGDTISTSPPIDPSTTFTWDSVSDVHAALTPESAGFAYSRNANPTVVALETAMARLEAAEEVVAFGSGMAAIHASLSSLQLWPGDVILASADLYGVTRSLLTQLGQFEIETRYVDVYALEGLERELAETRPRVLYFETITNPLLRVPDAAALIELARAHGAVSVIDNTFATPYLFRPLELGADLVIHSATKYIAGHGDVVAGLVAGKRSLTTPIRDARTVSGGVLSPFEAWLTMRGVRTLPLRMERQASNAAHIADWLSRQTWIESVHYPGLAGHSQHGTAARQFGGRFGAMIAFDLAADQPATVRFIDALQLITPGTSLGDVESLVLYPPLSSHRTLTPDQLAAMGIGYGLVRMSVGIENAEDLIGDLARAASTAGLVETRKAQDAARSVADPASSVRR